MGYMINIRRHTRSQWQLDSTHLKECTFGRSSSGCWLSLWITSNMLKSIKWIHGISMPRHIEMLNSGILMTCYGLCVCVSVCGYRFESLSAHTIWMYVFTFSEDLTHSMARPLFNQSSTNFWNHLPNVPSPIPWNEQCYEREWLFVVIAGNSKYLFGPISGRISWMSMCLVKPKSNVWQIGVLKSKRFPYPLNVDRGSNTTNSARGMKYEATKKI